MIELQQVTKTYAKNNKKAVDNLTLKVEGGELFGFIGPNGAGKTTTIKLMTGILAPEQGTVTMAGHNIATDRIAAQRLIGYVPDGNDLYDRLTGMEYLNFMADVYQVDAARRKAHIEKYLELFELKDAINSQVRSYSKGMKQKLVVIGALIHNPPVWILDEPLGGLDPRAASAEGGDAPALPGGQHRLFLHPCAGGGGETVHPYRRDRPRQPAGPGHAGRTALGREGRQPGGSVPATH